MGALVEFSRQLGLQRAICVTEREAEFVCPEKAAPEVKICGYEYMDLRFTGYILCELASDGMELLLRETKGRAEMAQQLCQHESR